MSHMILGRKIGMTQIFTDEGLCIPVTAVQVGPMTVLRKKSEAGKDGYAAIKVGFEDAARQEKGDSVRFRGVNKPEQGVFDKIDVSPKRIVREFRVTEAELDNYTVGQEIDHTCFSENDWIDVTGTSKGRGFTGVMKRHNFHGFKASHGVHESYRGGGSIGMSATPARVFKGTKMAGQHGNKQTTTQNLKIVRILAEDNIYLIKGAVPGANGGLVMVKPAVKKIKNRR